jgi:predicted nucleic acid-binding protein
MTALLDLNVLLDALLGREPWRAEADAIWDANREGRIGGRVSAAALPTLFYVIRKCDRHAQPEGLRRLACASPDAHRTLGPTREGPRCLIPTSGA